MKKLSTRTLSLRTETLANLSTDRLSQVGGGTYTDAGWTTILSNANVAWTTIMSNSNAAWTTIVIKPTASK